MRRWGESVGGARRALYLCCRVWHNHATLSLQYFLVIYSIVMSMLMNDDLYFLVRGKWEWKTASLL
jgi:hypothetical protein